MTLVIGSIQLGFIYAILAAGVYITLRILGTADLTVEGSFTLGLAVSASLSLLGHPVLGIIAALIAGGMAGIITGFLQTKAGIPAILSGILTMSGLYSINLLIMGSSSNLSFIGHDGIFELVINYLPEVFSKDVVKTALPILICAGLILVLIWFFHTHIGLCIRATGDNEDMVRASSINVDAMRIVTLGVANACVGLSGAVLAQYQRFADIGSGVGVVVVGLASVIIGEVVFGRRSVTIGFISAVVGAILYRFVIAIALSTSLFPAYFLKLISAVIVALALAMPTVKNNVAQMLQQKEAMKKNAQSKKCV